MMKNGLKQSLVANRERPSQGTALHFELNLLTVNALDLSESDTLSAPFTSLKGVMFMCYDDGLGQEAFV